MTDSELIEHARQLRPNCYAPYSRFPVTAALLAESGKVYAGVNVENASYGLTNCAERVAIGSGVAAGERHFLKIAILVQGGGSPCGACRQVLYEFAPQLEVLMADETGSLVRKCLLSELLPEAFGPQSLGD